MKSLSGFTLALHPQQCWGTSSYRRQFYKLLVLSVSYLPRSQILPSAIHPAASFTECFIRWQKRGQGGMWRIYGSWRDGLGTRLRLRGWQKDILTNPQMHLSYFCVPLNPASFLVSVLGGIAALWLAECWRPGCLWTACVPWACPRQQRVFLLPPTHCLSVRQTSACLPGTSWVLPLSRRQHRHSAAGTMPSGNTKADMMLHLQPVGGMAIKLSRCAVRQALRLLQIVPMAQISPGKQQTSSGGHQSIHH